MQLLTPIWLTALAALSIPVLIHLWNIRPGKTLKVGSIQWFQEASPANSRSFKLLDVLLMILRCLILALLAIILAAPIWERHIAKKKAKGWILIPQASFNYVKYNYPHQLDSLLKLGYQYHFFEPGFKAVDTAEHKQREVPRTDTLDYWQLMKQLPKAVSASVPIHLFTPNNLYHFKGQKPATPLNITWHVFTPADSIKNWLAGAWLNPSGGFRVVQGTAQPTGISYQYFNLNGDGDKSLFKVIVNNGLPVISTDNASGKITADTSTLHIAVYPGKNMVDAGYLQAALKAVEKFSQRKTQVAIYRQLGALPTAGDWLFWLADEPLKQTSFKNIFYYIVGKKQAAATWLENGDTQSGAKPAVYQTIQSNTTADEALWTDGQGRTLLGKQLKGDAIFYLFSTRFNPAYTNLVWDERFPLWLLKLTAKPLIEPPLDTRVLDKEQIMPYKIAGAAKTEIAPKQQVTINNYLWFTLMLLIVAERWLAYRKQTENANG